MKCKNITLYIIISFVLCLFYGNKGICLDLNIQPEEIFQGGIAIIHFEEDSGEEIKAIRFEDQPLPIVLKKLARYLACWG